jgi:hypothetical protein
MGGFLVGICIVALVVGALAWAYVAGRARLEEWLREQRRQRPRRRR